MTTPGDAARTSGGRSTPRSEQYPACDLYVPGHLVHFIQAKKASASDDPVRWGRFEAVDDGSLVVRFLDGTERYRIHRPADVARVAQVGDKVRVSKRWRIASVSRRFEHLLAVCIALPEDEWRPCSVASDKPASFEDLADRLAERGGFLVPGRLGTKLVASGPGTGEKRAQDGALDDVS